MYSNFSDCHGRFITTYWERRSFVSGIGSTMVSSIYIFVLLVCVCVWNDEVVIQGDQKFSLRLMIAVQKNKNILNGFNHLP
jgi:hypothetical protein